MQTLYLIDYRGKINDVYYGKLYAYDNLISALCNFKNRWILDTLKHNDYLDTVLKIETNSAAKVFKVATTDKEKGTKNIIERRELKPGEKYIFDGWLFSKNSKIEKLPRADKQKIVKEVNKLIDWGKTNNPNWNFLVQSNLVSAKEFEPNKLNLIKYFYYHKSSFAWQNHRCHSTARFQSAGNQHFSFQKAGMLYKEQLKEDVTEVNGKIYFVKYTHPTHNPNLIDWGWEMDGIGAKRSTGWKSHKYQHQWQVGIKNRSKKQKQAEQKKLLQDYNIF